MNWVVGFFFVVVGIPVLAGVGAAMFERWTRHREKMAELLAERTAEKAAQYAAQTERLEQRVRVLERIVTDRGIVIADEIEALRNDPPALQ